MNIDEAKQAILDRSREYFSPDRGGKGYVCPICGDGRGGSYGKNGITTKDGVHFTCWHGCFTHADIFEIIGIEHKTGDFMEQFKIACEVFGIEPEKHISLQDSKADAPEAQQPKEPQITDFTDLFKSAYNHISETDYPQQRGLSEAVIDRFKLGYVANWKHPKAGGKVPATPRLIIPVSRYSYLARDTRPEIPPEQAKYKKIKCKGKDKVYWIFNRKALVEPSSPIFVLEGEINALSVMEVGGEAVAIGSTAYTDQFINYLKAYRPKQPLLLAFDNDDAGRKASATIAGACRDLEIPYREVNISGDHNDANEALVADRDTFTQAVREAIEQAEEIQSSSLEAEAEQFFTESAFYSLQGFRAKIASGEKPTITSTGFSMLDEALNGGFRAGLYTIGAISSLGKTSFTLQLADNIAKQGRPVLFVSLEMARDELTAKILSRITYEKSMAKYRSFNTAKTTIGIQNTHNYDHYDPESRTIINEAIDELEQRGRDLIILEGIGNVRVPDIKARVEAVRAIRGIAPVVFVDYLQILAPEEGFRGTDKQATDKAVLELKRLSRDTDTPVICISSFNRDNYREPVNLASFKESGSIEYTADVLLGLQYAGMDYQKGEAEGSSKRRDRVNELIARALENGKRGRAQELELKILKNRNGNRGKVNLDFVPMFNYFAQAVRDEEDEYTELAGWTEAKGTYKQ